MSEPTPQSASTPALASPPSSAARSTPDNEWMGLPKQIWVRIGVVAALFACLFWPNLRRLWDKTNPFYGEANWGHAIGVPIIGLYYLYVNREKLFAPDPWPRMTERVSALSVWSIFATALMFPLALLYVLARDVFHKAAFATAFFVFAGLAWALAYPAGKLVRKSLDESAQWFGAAITLFGIALYGYAIYPGQNDFLKDFGMVVTLFGVVLALSGWGVMRTAWFPVVFLICAIPWPGLMYSRIAGPLQVLAAKVAVQALELTGVEASQGGTKIQIAGHGGITRTLNVAEACAGLRSLMTFISVGGAVAFLTHRPLWQKITVTLSAIPIAIFCNVMRVSGQGLLDHYVSQQLSENFAHQFVGMIMLIPAFLLILLVGWILDQIFVEEADHRRAMPKMIRRSAMIEAVRVPSRLVPARAPLGRSGPAGVAAGGGAGIANAPPARAPTNGTPARVASAGAPTRIPPAGLPPRPIATGAPQQKKMGTIGPTGPAALNPAARRPIPPTPPPSARLATRFVQPRVPPAPAASAQVSPTSKPKSPPAQRPSGAPNSGPARPPAAAAPRQASPPTPAANNTVRPANTKPAAAPNSPPHPAPVPPPTKKTVSPLPPGSKREAV